jgi:hypothetical protein
VLVALVRLVLDLDIVQQQQMVVILLDLRLHQPVAVAVQQTLVVL